MTEVDYNGAHAMARLHVAYDNLDKAIGLLQHDEAKLATTALRNIQKVVTSLEARIKINEGEEE